MKDNRGSRRKIILSQVSHGTSHSRSIADRQIRLGMALAKIAEALGKKGLGAEVAEILYGPPVAVYDYTNEPCPNDAKPSGPPPEPADDSVALVGSGAN